MHRTHTDQIDISPPQVNKQADTQDAKIPELLSKSFYIMAIENAHFSRDHSTGILPYGFFI